jgi:hypothetical protein
LNKKIDGEKLERENGLNNLSDKISTEIRDREEVNEAVTDALQVRFLWITFNVNVINYKSLN